MYSLTIHFGPNAIQWQFLFKEKEKAEAAYASISKSIDLGRYAQVNDDFGQTGMFGQIGGVLLEDINAMEEARIERSLADARASAKLQGRARTDPTIRAAQQGAPVLTPMGGGFRQ
jgi:hypothetical protein